MLALANMTMFLKKKKKNIKETQGESKIQRLTRANLLYSQNVGHQR